MDNDRQVVALTDLIVVRVVPGCDLERTGTELAVYILICNDRNLRVPKSVPITVLPMNFW